MLLFLVRHGEPIYDPDSLTPHGRRQAEAVAKRLALYGIDKVFTSTSNRAIETSVPTCEILHKKSTALDWCNENHAWEHFTIVNDAGVRTWMCGDDKCCEIFASPEVRKLDKAWFEHPFFADTKCKEGIEFINKHSDEFLAELGFVHDRENNVYHCVKENYQRIALFAHAGFSLGFLSSVLDIPYPMFCTHFLVNHSCVTVINFENKKTLQPRVLSFSNDSHLYREGLPTRFNELYF